MTPTHGASPSTTQWAFGAELERRRKAVGHTKRKAASRAGISESRWRQLESGVIRINGVEHSTNPKSETVVAAAKAVDWAPSQALELAGIAGWETYQDQPDAVSFNDAERFWKMLTESQKHAVLHVMATMAEPTSQVVFDNQEENVVPASFATAEQRGDAPRVSYHPVPTEVADRTNSRSSSR